VNLSQYAETLLESELFGHSKGAFTGAVSSHEGRLSLCGKHGSVFLDEIGDISPAIQIKLLKVLEERTFTEVGGHERGVSRDVSLRPRIATWHRFARKGGFAMTSTTDSAATASRCPAFTSGYRRTGRNWTS